MRRPVGGTTRPGTWSAGKHDRQLVYALALLAACATTPPPEPSVLAARDATPSTPTSAATPQPEPTPTQPFEEGAAGEGPELPTIAAPPPATPTPSPGVEEAAATAAEPASMLSRIGPNTAPHAAAALRLIEEGRQLMNQGSRDQAMERLERAVAIDPTNAYGYYFLAQLHYLDKKYDQAIAFASRAAVLSARTDRVCLGRVYSLEGAAFEDVGRYPDARKAYRKALEADPNNLAARVGAARLTSE